MVTRALYRGPAHVCVALNETLEEVTGDFRGVPIREQFPQLRLSGLFEAMDTVYITGEPIEMAWHSITDGSPATMLVTPVYDEDGGVCGVGLHCYPHQSSSRGSIRRLRGAAVRALPVTMLVVSVASAFG